MPNLTVDEACALPLLLRRSTPRCSVCRAELDAYQQTRPTWTVSDAAGCQPMCCRCYLEAMLAKMEAGQ